MKRTCLSLAIVLVMIVCCMMMCTVNISANILTGEQNSVSASQTFTVNIIADKIDKRCLEVTWASVLTTDVTWKYTWDTESMNWIPDSGNEANHLFEDAIKLVNKGTKSENVTVMCINTDAVLMKNNVSLEKSTDTLTIGTLNSENTTLEDVTERYDILLKNLVVGPNSTMVLISIT